MLRLGLEPFELKHFNFKTLIVHSETLKNNPLNDNPIRNNPILYPKDIQTDTPVVFMLSGFGSDAWKNFSFGGFEDNLAQQIDQWTGENLVPPAVYIFVNAWTKWGGSQFINSLGAGHYEDYILKDLVKTFKIACPEVAQSKNWIVMGGSSGGYGALNLGSKYPEVFPRIVALAPDSFFTVSLLAEIYKYLPYLVDFSGLNGFTKAYTSGQVKLPDAILFGLLNLVAMTTCYAPQDSKGQLQFPIDQFGFVDANVWSKWLEHDPLQFLPKREKQLKKLTSIHIYTGDKDEYGLQYGSRQMHELFNTMNLKCSYSELKGTHRSIKNFRQQALVDVLGSLQ